MISKEQIDEVKKSHPEAWQAKRSAGLTEEQAAQVILDQLEHDKNNPPEDEAKQRVISAVTIADGHEQRMHQARREAVKIMMDVKAQFPELDLDSIQIISAAEDGDVPGLNRLLEEHRDLIKQQAARIAELEGFLDDQGKNLADRIAEIGQQAERIQQLEADLKAALEPIKPTPKAKK